MTAAGNRAAAGPLPLLQVTGPAGITGDAVGWCGPDGCVPAAPARAEGTAPEEPRTEE